MVHKVKVKNRTEFKFGNNKPTTKAKANAQMRAAFANGYVPHGN